MADVSFEREEYKAALKKWQFVSDIVAGSDAVKAAKKAYLPMPNPHDLTAQNLARYEQYLARAVFYGATGNTLRFLIGAAFRKDPVLVVPTAIQYIETDVNGQGVSIYQQSQKALNRTLGNGRAGLLVDYPAVERRATKELHQKGFIRASINLVKANNIINWNVEHIGGVHRLSLVVIKEEFEQITSDGFGIKKAVQLRELRLVDGVYQVQVWRMVNQRWSVVEQFTPLDGAGKYWNEIPFSFIGSNDNDPDVDPIPLEDLAHINAAHYRNSADYEDSAFFCGQVQPWISGLDEAWRDHLETQGVYCGSRNPMLLPVGGSFGFAQAQPNTLVKEAMDTKEKQMIALGARLVERGQVAKTATESNSDNAAQHSVLSLCCANVSEAYNAALQWVMRFMDTNGDIQFVINQDFVEQKLDAQMLQALVGAYQSGQYPSSDLWAQLRKHGLIDAAKSDDDIKTELDADDTGLNLDIA